MKRPRTAGTEGAREVGGGTGTWRRRKERGSGAWRAAVGPN